MFRVVGKNSTELRFTSQALDSDGGVDLAKAGVAPHMVADHQGAIDHYLELLAREPDRADYHLILARTFEGLNLPAKAALSYSDVLIRDPECVEAYGPLTKLYAFLSQNSIEEKFSGAAFKTASRYVEKFPENPEAHGLLAIELGKLEKWPEALGQAELAAKSDPKQGIGVYSGLSSLQEEQGLTIEAYESAILAIECHHRGEAESTGHSNLEYKAGCLAAQLGRLEEAKAHLTTAVVLGAGDVAVSNQLHAVCVQLGEQPDDRLIPEFPSGTSRAFTEAPICFLPEAAQALRIQSISGRGIFEAFVIPAQPNNLFLRQVIECQGRDLEAFITLTNTDTFKVQLTDLKSKNEVRFLVRAQGNQDKNFEVVQNALGLAASGKLGECTATLNGLEEDGIFRTVSSPFLEKIEKELSDILRHSPLSDISISKTGAERALRGGCDFDSGTLRIAGTRFRFDLSKEPDGKMSLSMEVFVDSNQAERHVSSQLSGLADAKYFIVSVLERYIDMEDV